MKRQLLFSLLAFTMLAGCSKSENDTDTDANGRVPIRLNSGIGTVARAPIADDGKATVRIDFWETASEKPTYTAASTWDRTAEVASAASASAITLSAPVYYNADNDVKTFIKGWYPANAPTDGIVSFTVKNGTEDVLLSNTVKGSKNASDQVDAALEFNHQTAMLKFMVKKGIGLLAGTKIKSITVKGASVPVSLNLDTDVVSFEQKDLPVLNLATPILIADPAVTVGDALMIKPLDNNTLTLDIETTVDGTSVAATYTGVKFETAGDKKITMGKAYTITLTFSQTEVEPTAKIVPWSQSTGAGDVI